ncbi:hypothetical protein [Luteimonas sp. A649]
MGNRTCSRNEHGGHAFVDTAAEDVDTCGLRLFNHGMRVANYRLPLVVTTIAALGKEIRYLAIVQIPLN